MFVSPKWAIPFNKGIPLWMTELFAYPGTRITENLLKFTREYGDILVCQYSLHGKDAEKSSMGEGGMPIKCNSPIKECRQFAGC